MSKRLGKGLGAIFERNVTFVDEKQNEKVKKEQEKTAKSQEKAKKEIDEKENVKKEVVKKTKATKEKTAKKTSDVKETNSKKIKNKATASNVNETVENVNNNEMQVTKDDVQNVVDNLNNDAVLMIELKNVIPNPYQPRKDFDLDEINELSESIKKHGVIQPIVVKKNVKGYIIVAGERRYRACKVAGVKELPAIVRDFTEQEMAEVALIENIQRKDLNILEEALAYEQLMQNYDFTQQKLADNLGKKRSHIANALRLLKLPYLVREMLRDEKIVFGHAKVLLGVDDEETLVNLAKKVYDENLSVRELEKLVERVKIGKKPTVKTEKTELDMYFKHLQESLCRKLGTRVTVSKKPNQKKGNVTFEFMNEDDLNRILEILDLFEKI